MIILKFGGSSVASPERIQGISLMIAERNSSGKQIAVVVSAMGGVTDELIHMAKTAESGSEEYLGLWSALSDRHIKTLSQLLPADNLTGPLAEMEEALKELKEILRGVFLIKEASPRTLDTVLSFGERLSAFMLSRYFSSQGIPSSFKDARAFIRTDDRFGNAQVDLDTTRVLVQKELSLKDTVPVITGFIASSEQGHTTTLGRGGSDYTAAIIAASLDAEALEIWTDVNGVLTADPRAVSHAYSIPELSYEEAMELSHFGAKVIYPPTIQPALDKRIPIFIKNTFEPTHPGSRISADTPERKGSGMTGLTSIQDVSLLTLSGSGLVGIPGTAARFFQCLGRHGVNIIMITQASSEHSICVAISGKDASPARKGVEEEFIKEVRNGLVNPIQTEDERCIIAMVGEGMRNRPGVAGRLFSALGRNGINVSAVAQGSSELNVTFAAAGKDRVKSLNLLHDAFFEEQKVKLHVFLIGVGLIGGTLLDQIIAQHASLMKEKDLDIRIIGLANSRKMICNREGIVLTNWKNQLEELGEKSSLEAIADRIESFNLANTVLVDCTANPDTPSIYQRILGNSVSIATANKVAASSSQKSYDELLQSARKSNALFMNETNVGAGLPVLATLRNLVESGDKVKEIQAVISGSLSYIFNNFNGERSFIELVKEARELGYTEPDPREDLSGNDIKRKIIILARVAGFKLEPTDVEVEPLLPASCIEAPDVDSFFIELDKQAAYFSDLIDSATKEGSRLRYIAAFKDGKAKVSLHKVKDDSPFFNLASTDNMIVVFSERYATRPLTVAGPGSGAHVTAAGVFAELIQLGNRNHD